MLVRLILSKFTFQKTDFMNPTGKKILLFFLALAFGCAFGAPLRAERLPVRIYTSADGLGSSFVDYLMRDSRGFMWFCTRDGLSRFDGSRFITYEISAGETSPPGIESIFQSRDGAYWVSTTGGTYRFDLSEITRPDPVKPRINAQFITGGRGQFFEDSRGNLYITSGTFSRIIKQDDRYVLEQISLNLPKRDAALVIADIGETKDGSLWLNSSWGLIRRLPDDRLVFYPTETNYSSGNASMMVDKSGRVWISVANRVLVLKPEPLDVFNGAGKLTIKSLEPTAVEVLK